MGRVAHPFASVFCERRGEILSGDYSTVTDFVGWPTLSRAFSASEGWGGIVWPYSTVTDFAKFLGWSTSQPRRTAM
jgi:hypothetical protein